MLIVASIIGILLIFSGLLAIYDSPKHSNEQKHEKIRAEESGLVHKNDFQVSDIDAEVSVS